MKLKLLREVSSETSAYQKRLERIHSKILEWSTQIFEEKRLGLSAMDQIVMEAGFDPYNSANPAQGPQQNDTMDFEPQQNVARPVINKNTQPKRMHIIYDPTQGEVSKAIKTGLVSRPPPEYIEANAQQVHDALKHLEQMNPKLADLLTSGHLSVWVPRNATAVKRPPMGLEGGSGPGGMNTRHMSDDQLAQARSAADNLSLK